MGTFDWNRYELLGEAYQQALQEGSSHFFFDNQDWDTGFAKYMLEFLSQILKKD